MGWTEGVHNHIVSDVVKVHMPCLVHKGHVATPLGRVAEPCLSQFFTLVRWATLCMSVSSNITRCTKARLGMSKTTHEPAREYHITVLDLKQAPSGVIATA